MGLFDLLKPTSQNRKNAAKTKTALEAAADPGHHDGADGAVNRVLQMVLNIGLDGGGPLPSAADTAATALANHNGDVEKAVDAIGRRALVRGGIGGFVTGLGGFITMPVALPLNVVEFYVQATQMVGATAKLRGYDLRDPRIRTAILLTLVGSDANEVLKKAGLATGSGRVASLALKQAPPALLMVINKAVGFRLLQGVGTKVFSRLGRGIPLVGGLVGGGVDAMMMKAIAESARKEFPPLTR